MDSDRILLQSNDVPCFYEIGFDAVLPALLVRLHKEIVPKLPSLEQARISEEFERQLGIEPLQNDWHGNVFGFGGCWKRTQDQGDFLSFSCPLPQLEQICMMACGYCGGGQQGLFFECPECKGLHVVKKTQPCRFCNQVEPDSSCLWCRGEGKVFETWMDHKTFFAISATFSIFFELMYFTQERDKFVSSNKPQLLSVQTSTASGSHGAPIYANLSIPLVQWLQGFSAERPLLAAQQALRVAWERMYGAPGKDLIAPWCVVRQGGKLSMGCAERATLYPVERNSLLWQGYELSCHNVDHVWQQLSFLSALAALCDEFRSQQ